jgi:hypothetical protein
LSTLVRNHDRYWIAGRRRLYCNHEIEPTQILFEVQLCSICVCRQQAGSDKKDQRFVHCDLSLGQLACGTGSTLSLSHVTKYRAYRRTSSRSRGLASAGMVAMIALSMDYAARLPASSFSPSAIVTRAPANGSGALSGRAS